jgi:hypothetical protein
VQRECKTRVPIYKGIGDLVIESIDLCDDRWLDISIGS